MIKFLYIILFLQFIFSPAQAELYKKLKCNSSLSVKTKGQKGKKTFQKGSFEVRDSQSQVISVLGYKGKVVLKIFPWYGVDFKPSKLISVTEKQTSSTTDFSFSFIEKRSKKAHFLSCKKL